MRWRGENTTAPHVPRRGARRGTAALEFALLFPVMVTIMFGLVDASSAMIAYRRVTVAAEEAALIATELSVQPDNSLTLTPQQVYQAGTAIFGVIPGLQAKGPAQQFSVTISAVVFTGAPSGCSGTDCTSYTANVAWSVPLCAFSSCTGSASQYLGEMAERACGELTQVSQATKPTLTTIQTLGMTSLSSVLVVDVTYRFVPTFTRVFGIAPIFQRTAVLPPRLVPPSADAQYITYDLNGGKATDPEIYGRICTQQNYL